MAVNKLLPFANGVGANVVDYATWSSLSTLLGQGFVTGVARSDYANRVFAQGALASYILGQFVVDQTAQDADLNETTFYTNFKNALKAYVESNAVALNGAQTVGGVKTFTSSPVVPTATAGDNTQKAASTAFVKKAIDDSVNNVKAVSYDVQTLTDPEKAQARANISAADASAVVDKTTNQTVGGVKTFSDSPIIPTATAGDNSQKAASTAFVKKAIDDSVADVGAVSYKVQTLTESEQTQARTNIGAAKESEVVKIVAQTLTEAEKAQVRANIDAADASDVVHLTGSESVSGVKTFTDAPIVPTQAIEDFSQKAASTAFVQTKVRSEVDQLQAQLNALEGAVLTATENTAVAYSKPIPTSANLFKYAAIRNYGGRSIVWNQLWRMYPAADLSKNRCSVVLADGVYTATCTSDQYTYWGFYRNNLRNIVGHKYLYLCEFRVNVQTLPVNFEMRPRAGYVTASASDTWIQFQKIYTEAGSSPVVNFTLSGQAAAVGDEFSVRNPMMIDLTLMFGAGNEPSTVEEFRAMFPEDYYAYTEGEIKSAGVNKIVSADSNSVEIDAKTIPQAILALPGYGWSAGSAKNWVDWENKVYHQEVGQVDLGVFTWTYDAGTSRFITSISAAKNVASWNGCGLTCERYVADRVGSDTQDDQIIGIFSSVLYIRDTRFTDPAALAQSLSGVMIHFGIATSVETDISALIDDNTIEVESGGSLTFENTNGDDYRIPVPSSVVTMEKP